MHTTLIVARMKPQDREEVARIFAESDSTELPQLIGVSQRTLFQFHDLYFHLIESPHEIGPKLGRAQSHPLFQQVNAQLAAHIEPYHPSWREPKDAVAEQFYRWSAAN